MTDGKAESDEAAAPGNSCQSNDLLDQRLSVDFIGREKIDDPAGRMHQRMPGRSDQHYAQRSAQHN